MKYWVFIKEKVDGPYDENNLVTLQGFTPDTLICSEESASAGKQEWVKASSVFEFDEVPVEQPAATPAISAQQPAPAAMPTMDASILLDKLNAISNEMFMLQERLESMQKRLDDSLATQAASASASAAASANENIPQDRDDRVQTITLSTHALPDTKPAKDTPTYPAQAAPEEEEVVIRSALDSMYAEQLANSLQEDSFQDLLPHKEQERKETEAKAVAEIGKELEFIPVTEEDQAVIQEALVTTPSADEAAKDALINELTASPKEDVLDQIIQEHQAEKKATPEPDLPPEPVAESSPQKNEEIDLPLEPVEQEEPAPAAQPQTADTQADSSEKVPGAAVAAIGALAAGAIATALDKSHTQAQPSATPSQTQEPASLQIAPDKNQPEQVEPVLPAQQMPEDVPQNPEAPALPGAELPTLEETALPTPNQEQTPAPVNELPELEHAMPSTQQPASPAEEAPASQQAPADLPSLDDIGTPQDSQTDNTPQEVPFQEPLAEPPHDSDEIEELVAPTDTPAPEQAPTANKLTLTDKDLEDAFGPDVSKPEPTDSNPAQPEPEQASSALAEVEQLKTMTASTADETITHASNPNDLTEIELKEGSTYLISDFVPPAQITDNAAEVMEQQPPVEQDKKQETTAFQDMLAATITNQSTQPLPLAGLPADVAATQVNLENTIQAKRGATLDIKTVPMVPEPAQTERLDVNELNDVNAQHDMKHAGTAKGTKLVVGGLITLLLLIIAYVLLGMMHLLPDSINLLGGKKQPAATQPASELLEQKPAAPAPAPAPQPSPADQALMRVQNFPLPNGYTLKAFIESKHTFANPEMISWTVAEAVEPDNYSITVKIPPENPQSFQNAYRFNYNMVTGLLEPTISDAKNLLDQAYGLQQAAPQQQAAVTQPAPVPQKAAPKKQAAKSRTGRATSRTK